MSPELTILLAIGVPLLGSAAILLTGKFPNIRETATLVTAVTLFLAVVSLVPCCSRWATERYPLEILPGLDITFTVEPLGMLFGLIASGLWIVNSLYSIGYTGNKEQTRPASTFSLQ